MKRLARIAAALALVAMATGCAISTNHPQDPLENFNRAMFNFNDGLDRVILKPTAEVYRESLPDPVQAAVGNFFENISDVWTAVNNFLQGKPAQGVNDVMRFAVNSTLGLGGLIDLGSAAGMPKHKQDFGATLGVWGVGAGPYLVLPFLGPSTVRDTVALPLDSQGDLLNHVSPVRARNAGTVLRLVDKRAAILDASNLLEDAALDRYEFLRDGFLQRRSSKIDNSRPNSQDNDDGSDYPVPKNADPKGSSLPPDNTLAVDGQEPALEPVVEFFEASDHARVSQAEVPGAHAASNSALAQSFQYSVQ